jgi:methionyl-tRNA formyltransferase
MSATPLRIVIFTQDDVFFLPQAVDFLLRRLRGTADVVGAATLPVSPFGAKKSFVRRAIETWQIFGSRFFLHYALRYLWAKTRGQDVLSVLNKNGIVKLPADENINGSHFIAELKKLKPDVLVSLAANEIFRDRLISVAPLGILNLHTSLLPLNRGLMPSFWCLANGDEETGVTVFQVDRGIDSGPILVQKRLTIDKLSQWELIRITKFMGMEAIVEAIEGLSNGTAKYMPNPDADSTYNRFPTKDDVRRFRRRGGRFF